MSFLRTICTRSQSVVISTCSLTCSSTRAGRCTTHLKPRASNPRLEPGENALSRGGHRSKTCLLGTFFAQTPHSPSRACRRRPWRSTPTADPCVSSVTLRVLLLSQKRGAATLGAIVPSGPKPLATGRGCRRLRRRHACGLGHPPALWPRPLGRLRRPSADSYLGEYSMYI